MGSWRTLIALHYVYLGGGVPKKFGNFPDNNFQQQTEPAANSKYIIGIATTGHKKNHVIWFRGRMLGENMKLKATTLLLVSLMISSSLQSWIENGAYLRHTNYPNMFPLHTEHIQYFNTVYIYIYEYIFLSTLLEAPQWYNWHFYFYIFYMSIFIHIAYVKYIHLSYLV